MKKAVVIFSGGQDSTTCLHWAKKEFDTVNAITFDYNQKHSAELKQATRICNILGIPHVTINLDFLGRIAESALIGQNKDVNDINEKGLPASFVPNRNQLFITLAHAYAQKIEAQHLVAGMCETDYSGYPDCRQTYINLIQITSNIGSDSNILIHTPLMNLSKGEIFMLAHDLDCLEMVITESHTCYNGDRTNLHEWGYGCNDCPACELRKNGYNEFLTHKNDE